MIIILGLLIISIVLGLWMIVDVTDAAQDPERVWDRSLLILRKICELGPEPIRTVRRARDFSIVARPDGTAVAVVKWGRANPSIVVFRIRPVPTSPNHCAIEVGLPRGTAILLGWWAFLNVTFGIAWVWFGGPVSQLLLPASLIIAPIVAYVIAIAAQYDYALSRLSGSKGNGPRNCTRNSTP
jgi:hypothetical protein